jgi:hypothetical protein
MKDDVKTLLARRAELKQDRKSLYSHSKRSTGSTSNMSGQVADSITAEIRRIDQLINDLGGAS